MRESQPGPSLPPTGRSSAPSTPLGHPRTGLVAIAVGDPMTGRCLRRSNVRGEVRPAAQPAEWDRRSALTAAWSGRAIVVIATLAAVVTLAVNDNGPTLGQLAANPTLLDIDALSGNPLRSLWLLHSQVPMHNAVVGLVGWLPVPLVGTLFVLYAAALLATGLMLHGVLVRWETSPLAAGVLVGLALVNPALLSTVGAAGFQVPLALLVVGSVLAAQRYFDRPTWPRLLALSTVLTAAALTWQVMAPGWVPAILAVVLVARPAGWRRTLLALAVPVLFLGAWAVKNEHLFGEPTLASSVGFEMQRGITGPMSVTGVGQAVADGAVSPLAQQQPWGSLAYYGPDRAGTGPCIPTHGDPVTFQETKASAPDDAVVPNYNAECYLPLYRQARYDAVELVSRYPGRYVTTRDSGLVLAYDTAEGCYSDPCTWMDRLYQPLLGKVDGQVTMYDWNLHLFGTDADSIDVNVSMVLVMASAAVGWRGLVAAWRVRRIGWRARDDRWSWPTGEVLWVVAALTVALVIGGTALYDMGGNAGLRSAVDPLLLTLPLAALVRWLWPQRRPAAPAPSPRGQRATPPSTSPPAEHGPAGPAPDEPGATGGPAEAHPVAP
jgi:hypothetical protein